MSKLYTGQGDDGYTRRLGEGRLPKHHPVTEAVGSIDEASAALGVARATSQARETKAILLQVQRDLYHLMAEVSATPKALSHFQVIDGGRVSWLEQQIDLIGAMVQLPNEFIVPGDSLSGASIALARTIVRRAERRVARLMFEGENENYHLLQYLNRLSSLCFALELFENQVAGNSNITIAKE